MRPASAFIASLVALGGASAQADVTGHWQLTLAGGPAYVDLVQTGDAVSFDMTLGGYPLHFDGSVDGPQLFASSDDGPCPTAATLVIFDDNFTLDGYMASYGGACSQPSRSRMTATRCECDHDSVSPGSGCDEHCRIEPCFTCSGSTCTPLGDGSACDDRHDCTSGETCSAGVCSGGAPVASCIDMTGHWLRQFVSSGPIPFYETEVDITQRDGTLRVYTDGALGPMGSIDTSTGDFHWYLPGPSYCSDSSESGVVAADGQSWAATGYGQSLTPHFFCASYDFSDYGYRCGNGLVGSGETCDDGNHTSGDGCSDSCQVEPCWVCDGAEPSDCSPDPVATTCDDGDDCTSGDTCSGNLCIGQPVACAACNVCVTGSGCVVGAHSDCAGAVEPDRTRLQITDRSDDTKDQLRWMWKKGAATSSFGNPLTTDDVALCLFDESSPAATLAFEAIVPVGGACASPPCWEQSSSGAWSYEDDAGNAGGITSIRMKPGAAGKSSIDVRGKGAGLETSPAGLPSAPLGLPLRVQLQISGGACFEGAYADPSRNEDGMFKASGVP